MKKLILPLLYFVIISCNTNYGQLTPVTRLPKALTENSGIEVITRDSTLWAVNDSGNKNYIYKVGFNGDIFREIKIKHAENIDWEELTKDDNNNLYIGDFGNNSNKRKDLTIYKIKNPDTVKGEQVKAEKITFYYPEQKDFPPKKKHKYYDAEAFFYLDGYFYLFTKNHANPFNGISFLYKIPAEKGHHKAERIGEHVFYTDKDKCKVTAAAISPDKRTVALLGHDRVWLFSGFENDNFFDAPVQETIELHHSSQKEGLCFLDDDTLLISDEQNSTSGRNLYRIELNAVNKD
ncbi:hypothetical protein [Sinomicrobium weinanense]|uniref:Uncharacterized protein n=1 Tax=Sinomicrobium weinanense TaxID=2842200 RepID=A0A926Q2Y5_9FLAO|nr:hypothetical protein [Sinomicrobium weinanense]MBC9795175.1 hypothetical protein [Sinomicrobium weinanense]MBU3121952.1 hypothetical protein [Sinomicrobium weinanense]